MVFSRLQNADTGEFDIQGIAGINAPVLAAVVGGAVLVVVILAVVRRSVIRKNKVEA